MFERAYRLIADALEAAWNDRLRALAASQERYEAAREADARVVSDEQRAEILALATDFPRLWRDPPTSAREKKRMMRLLIADVTLAKGDKLHAISDLRVAPHARWTSRGRKHASNCAPPTPRSSARLMICWTRTPMRRLPTC